MTANISVHIAEAKGVVAAVSAAFRYRPADERRGYDGTFSPRAQTGDRRKAIYLLGEDGKPEKMLVETGLSDGTYTEIKTKEKLEGREVVLGVMTAPTMSARGDASSNPFMPKRQPRTKKRTGVPGAPR
jgi:HlyD family secretion protein